MASSTARFHATACDGMEACHSIRMIRSVGSAAIYEFDWIGPLEMKISSFYSMMYIYIYIYIYIYTLFPSICCFLFVQYIYIYIYICTLSPSIDLAPGYWGGPRTIETAPPPFLPLFTQLPHGARLFLGGWPRSPTRRLPLALLARVFLLARLPRCIGGWASRVLVLP